MKKIGLLSDTHSFLDEKVFHYFKDCDEVWHAGDIGNPDVTARLESFKPLRAVYGNIDGTELRANYPKDQRFFCENMDVWITHIGGYPPRYNPEVKRKLIESAPDIFICGHSHILKIMTDPSLNKMLYINPGAAGRVGFHSKRTLVRFQIDDKKASAMEVIELGTKA